MLNGQRFRMILSLLRPDPKLHRAFDVLPLAEGDLAATGHRVRWYQDWIGHEKLTDEFWTPQSHTASVSEVTAPVYMITGWYDIFLPWQLRNYAQLAEAGRPPRLTVKPWGHLSQGMGAPSVSETVAFLREHFTDAESDRVAPIRAYLTGTDRWFDLASWPPPGTRTERLHPHRAGGLSTDLPTGGSTVYVYDPADPTPALGGPGLQANPDPVDNTSRAPGTGCHAITSAGPVRETFTGQR
ncbi:CocE/NonD family hydrolase [Nocardia sp. NPDC005366]|uniref:CocE/NonD family hydrolase n=1 Tax=Nocardia sp. NPDC005366 TaxID=3156878 RepID=UPI0033A6369C